MNGEMHNWALFLNPPDILLRKCGSFCDLCYDLLIVLGNLQLFRNSVSKLAAAAAKFTADGDNPFHIVLLSCKVFWVRLIITAHEPGLK